MKKLLTILFLLPLFCFGQFGWSNLLPDQWVSFTDAQGSGISTKQAVPTSAEWMTKANCDTYFNLDLSKLSGYASNQWVTKNDLYQASIIPATYYMYITDRYNYLNQYDACSDVMQSQDSVYSATFPPSVGMTLYSNTALTTVYSPTITKLGGVETSQRDDYFSVGLGSTKSKVGQTFLAMSDAVIKTAHFYIQKGGSPSGNAYAKIYATTGTGGSKICTGEALAVSDAVNVLTISDADFYMIEFPFTGENQITLSSGTEYACVLEFAGGSTGNGLKAGIDLTEPVSSGNMVSQVNGDGTWYSDLYDTIFSLEGKCGTDGEWHAIALASNTSVVYSYTETSGTVTSISQCSAYSLTISGDTFTPNYLEQDIYISYTADDKTYDIVSNNEWITITGGISAGSGNFLIHITGNDTNLERTGTVSVRLGSQTIYTITITQGP